MNQLPQINNFNSITRNEKIIRLYKVGGFRNLHRQWNFLLRSSKNEQKNRI